MPRRTPAPPPSRASQLLSDWLEQSSTVTGAALADALGVHRQLVYGWTSGRTRPTREYARAIEAITGGAVPELEWTDAEQSSALAETARAHLAGRAEEKRQKKCPDHLQPKTPSL